MVSLRKERRPGNRSRGGRPKSAADPGPNPAVLAQRTAFGLGPGQPFTPLGVAEARNWLDPRDVRAASGFAALHRAAHLDGPRVPSQSDLSNPEAVDVRAVSWSAMSDKEIAAVWESALASVRGPSNGAETFAVLAMRRWKAACAAMTADQLREVVRFCVDDSWPQWIIHRNAGHFDSGWERQRALLVAGLRAISADKTATPDAKRAA